MVKLIESLEDCTIDELNILLKHFKIDGRTKANNKNKKIHLLKGSCEDECSKLIEIFNDKRKKRFIYEAFTIDELKRKLNDNKVSVNSLRKADLIDICIDRNIKMFNSSSLDSNQEELMERILSFSEKKDFAISAGPGSGKTLFIIHIIRNILKMNQSAKITVICFNVNAVDNISTRLMDMGIKVNKTELRERDLVVLTFDKYIYHFRLWKNGYDQSYEINFESGLKYEDNDPIIDYLIIDEAQDMNDKHFALVNQMKKRVKKLVLYLGDPKQEIYPHSNLFSKLWNDTLDDISKGKLAINYRSENKIVNFLNSYTSKHFKNLHFEQISSKGGDGDVAFHIVSKECIAEFILDLYVKDEMKTFIISPVTRETFNVDKYLKDIEQTFHDARKEGRNIKVSKNPNIDFYNYDIYIGHSYNFKGLEVDRVICIFSDLPYQEYGIDKGHLLKLIYVAISRAIKKIDIILCDQKTDIWDDFYQRGEKYIPRERLIKGLETVTRVSKKISLPVTILKDEECEMVENEVSCNHPDFAGIFMETALANKCGYPIENYLIRRAKVENNIIVEPLGFKYLNDNDEYKYEIVFNPRQRDLDQLIEQLEKTNLNYKCSVLKYSAEIGKLWTISEAYKNFQPAFTNKLIASLSGSSYQMSLSMDVMITRSDKKVTTIQGVVDFMSEDEIIEIKYAKSGDEYISQTLLYASIAEKRGRLINLKEGFIKTIQPLDKSYLNDFLRARKALDEAIILSQMRKYERIDINQDLFLSIDVEHNGPEIVEIGALLFDKRGKIIDCLNVLSSSWADSKEIRKRFHGDFGAEDFLYKQSNLVKINNCASNEEMILKINSFLEKIEYKDRNIQIVKWGGNDDKILNLICNIDLLKEVRKMKFKSKSNTLQNIKEILLGSDNVFPFVAHRAFEDAVITAAILVYLTKEQTIY